jgi:hypothetical protein
MDLKDILFSVNEYDRDGDRTDIGIYLHFGDTRVKVADDLDQFKLVVDRIRSMVDEIRDNYEVYIPRQG